MEPTDPAFAMRGRTNDELVAAFKDDMLIYIFRVGIESIFGGLWLLLLLTVGYALANIVRVWMYGFKDEKERRQQHYIQDLHTQTSILIFFCIVLIITTVLLSTEIGRRVLSFGTVAFIFGTSAYFFFCSDMIYTKKGIYREIEENMAQEVAEVGEKLRVPAEPQISQRKIEEIDTRMDEVYEGATEAPQKRPKKKKSKAKKHH